MEPPTTTEGLANPTSLTHPIGMDPQTAQMIPAWIDGTLVPVEKLAVHQRGLRHRAISVFVMDGRHLLLQQRAAGKYHTPLLWANTCCTHPRWNEAPEACAKRRLTEELGITGLDLRHRGQVEYRAEVGGDMIEHELVDLFTADAARDLILNPDPSEVLATRWMDLDALVADVARNPAQYTPWLAIYLAQHSDRIFGTP